MRRKVKNRNTVAPDHKYGSLDVAKFINHIMERGKKETARKIVYGALDELKSEGDPLKLFDTAITNAGPNVEVRGRRIGGANYQVPREVRPERKQFLAMKWIKAAATSGKGKPMQTRLAEELKLAAAGEGAAVKKREDTHRMAEANKAFAHFSW